MAGNHYPETADPFSVSSPAEHALAVTRSDTVDLTAISRALYVGGAGDLKVTMSDGAVVVFSAVPAGTLLPIRVRRVWLTGTAATNIVALY